MAFLQPPMWRGSEEGREERRGEERRGEEREKGEERRARQGMRGAAPARLGMCRFMIDIPSGAGVCACVCVCAAHSKTAMRLWTTLYPSPGDEREEVAIYAEL